MTSIRKQHSLQLIQRVKDRLGNIEVQHGILLSIINNVVKQAHDSADELCAGVNDVSAFQQQYLKIKQKLERNCDFLILLTASAEELLVITTNSDHAVGSILAASSPIPAMSPLIHVSDTLIPSCATTACPLFPTAEQFISKTDPLIQDSAPLIELSDLLTTASESDSSSVPLRLEASPFIPASYSSSEIAVTRMLAPSSPISPAIPSVSAVIPSASPVIPSALPVISSVSPVIPSVSPAIPSASAAIPSASAAVPSVSPVIPSVLPVIPSILPVIPSVSSAIPSASPVIQSILPVIPSASSAIPSASATIPSASAAIPSASAAIPSASAAIPSASAAIPPTSAAIPSVSPVSLTIPSSGISSVSLSAAIPSASVAMPSASAAIPSASAAVPSISAAIPSASAAIPSASTPFQSVSVVIPSVSPTIPSASLTSASPVLTPDPAKASSLVSMSTSTCLHSETAAINFQDGQMVDVIVSEIVSPHCFYIQFSDKPLGRLMDQINDYIQMHKVYRNTLSLADLEIGMLCLAQYSINDKYYRAQVTCIYKSSNTDTSDNQNECHCDVFYIDYGNREQLPWSRIQHLPQKFATLPAQACCCSLAKVVPLDGVEWPGESIIYLKRVAEASIIRCRPVCWKNKVIADVILYTLSKKEVFSIADLMVMNKLARVNSMSESGQHRPDAQVKKPAESVPEASKVPLINSISETKTTNNVKCSSNNRKVNLKKYLISEHTKSDSNIAYSEEPSCTYNSRPWRIENRVQSGGRRGGAASGSTAACQRARVQPPHTVREKESGNTFHNDKHRPEAKFVRRDRNKQSPCKLSSANTQVSSNRNNVQSNGTRANLFPEPVNEVTGNLNRLDSIESGIVPDVRYGDTDGSLSPDNAAPNDSKASNKVNTRPIFNNIISELNLHQRIPIEVILSHIDSATHFYVHCVSGGNIGKMLSMLEDKLAAHFNDEQHVMPLPYVEVGNLCICRFSEDGLYYRALIEEGSGSHRDTNDLQYVKVHYIDYGNTEWVPDAHLYALPEGFADLAPQAVRCQLAFLSPMLSQNPSEDKRMSASGSWSEEATKAFVDLTGFEKKILMYALPEAVSGELDDDDPVPVVLVDTNDNGDICINSVMADRSYAWCFQPPKNWLNPGKRDQAMDLWDPAMDDHLEERNSYNVDVDDVGMAITGFQTDDDRTICRFFNTSTKCWRGESCPFQHIPYGKEAFTREKQETYAYTNDELELPQTDTIIALEVTAIYSPTHFYAIMPWGAKPLSDVDSEQNPASSDSGKHREDLQDLVESMTEYYNSSVYRDSQMTLRAEGELVAAHFSKDSMWYRAKVIAANSELSEVKIFYLDYGNTEVLLESKIRSIAPQFLHLPHQAVECFMQGAEPADGSNKWSPESVCFFKDYVDGKDLVALIINSDSARQQLDLELFDTKFEDVNISELLIKQGFGRKIEFSPVLNNVPVKTSDGLRMMPG